MTNFTDNEREQIKAFINNPAMSAAVFKALLPLEDFGDRPDLPDAEYGRALRVWIGTRDLVRARIEDLKRIASGNPQAKPVNEAR
jgi:hypothetical protein